MDTPQAFKEVSHLHIIHTEDCRTMVGGFPADWVAACLEFGDGIATMLEWFEGRAKAGVVDDLYRACESASEMHFDEHGWWRGDPESPVSVEINIKLHTDNTVTVTGAPGDKKKMALSFAQAIATVGKRIMDNARNGKKEHTISECHSRNIPG